MMLKKLLSVSWLFLIFINNINSQAVEQPNYGLKSHETLEINKVEMNSDKTIFFMSIENRIEGGAFCADRNIYLIYPDGSRSKLVRAAGIPACPDSFKFKSIGEKLQFTLEFPPLKAGTKWIDIIEECSVNCFWFYGITLDNDLNNRLDEAFSLASKGKPADNIILFGKILDSIESENPGIQGLLYINIINAATEASDFENAGLWYKKLTRSNVPRLSYYIKYLNDKGIKY